MTNRGENSANNKDTTKMTAAEENTGKKTKSMNKILKEIQME